MNRSFVSKIESLAKTKTDTKKVSVLVLPNNSRKKEGFERVGGE